MVDENGRTGSRNTRFLTARLWRGFALTLLSAACATPASEGPDAGPETRIVRTPAGVAEVVIPGRNRREEVAASADRVLRALLIRYQALGLEPDWLEPEKGIVGITRIDLRDELGDRELGFYFHCGRTSTMADFANESRVQTSVVSYVVQEAETSTILTRVEAVAHPLTAGGGQTHECTTSGELESLLADGVRRMLGL